MASASVISLEDRVAADVFGKSYREVLLLKENQYRWSHLAPQSVAHLQESCDRNWSADKLGDYLHCDAVEAEACRRRFIMSKKVNGKPTTAARLRQAAFEWIGEVAELDDATRNRLAEDLSRMIGNQLFVAAQAGEDLRDISAELEGAKAGEEAPPGSPPSDGGSSAKWGPQWKD